MSGLKSIVLSLALVLLCFQSDAQTEIEFKFGGPNLRDRPEAVDQQSGYYFGLTIKKEYPLNSKFFFEPGLGYSLSVYFMDGHFTRRNSEMVFQKIPANYQQNGLQELAINMPLLFKYQIFANSQGEGVAIGAGSHLSYIVNMRQSYKLDGVNYSEKVKDINRLQSNFVFDVGTSGNVMKHRHFAVGFGVQYQLSQHLENSNSFKPLIPYLRFGLRF